MGLPRSPFFFAGGSGGEAGEDKPAMGLPCWLFVTLKNLTNWEHGLYVRVWVFHVGNGRSSITPLKPILSSDSSWGPNPLDEEVVVKSAMGISSLTSGFTIWSSNGWPCLLSKAGAAFEVCNDMRD